MKLDFESGRIVEPATEEAINEFVEIEDFSILSIDEMTYIQCGRRDTPGDYSLEYQDGSLDSLHSAEDEHVTIDRVISAFVKYLRGDETWREGFQWEKMDLF